MGCHCLLRVNDNSFKLNCFLDIFWSNLKSELRCFYVRYWEDFLMSWNSLYKTFLHVGKIVTCEATVPMDSF